MLLVAAVYQQITNQHELVLHGIKGNDLQSTFDVIQPMLSGNLDIQKNQPVSQDLTKNVLSYIQSLWAKRHMAGGMETTKSLTAETAQEDLRISKTAAIEGFYIRLERGRLGLEKA
jgi:hypothetical protein